MIIGLFSSMRRLQIGDIFLDGHTSENATLTAQATSIPIEVGANVVDNVIIEPMTLSVSAYMSEGNLFTFGASGVFNDFKRTTDALDVLRQAQVNRVALDVYCNTGYYRNMMLTEIKPSCSVDSVTMIIYDLTFQEMIFTGESEVQNPFDPKYNDSVNRGSLQLGDAPL